MVRLSEMYRLIGEYLEANGDKEVTSIGTWGGSSKKEFTFNLRDVGSGKGFELPTGEDVLDIPKM